MCRIYAPQQAKINLVYEAHPEPSSYAWIFTINTYFHLNARKTAPGSFPVKHMLVPVEHFNLRMDIRKV
jgi:hypothetical protein